MTKDPRTYNEERTISLIKGVFDWKDKKKNQCKLLFYIAERVVVMVALIVMMAVVMAGWTKMEQDLMCT